MGLSHSFFTSFPLEKKKLNCDQVCVCVLHASFGNHSRKTPVRLFFPFAVFPLLPAWPASLTCPPSLLISPRSDHSLLMAHGKCAEFIAAAAGVVTKCCRLSLSHNPLLMSPPVVFWVRGSIPQHCSHHHRSSVRHCAEAHSSCNSGTCSVYAGVLLLRELNSGSASRPNPYFIFNLTGK